MYLIRVPSHGGAIQWMKVLFTNKLSTWKRWQNSPVYSKPNVVYWQVRLLSGVVSKLCLTEHWNAYQQHDIIVPASRDLLYCIQLLLWASWRWGMQQFNYAILWPSCISPTLSPTLSPTCSCDCSHDDCIPSSTFLPFPCCLSFSSPSCSWRVKNSL